MDLETPVPCIRGHFGEQLNTFQTMLSTSSVETILGHDPRSAEWRKLAVTNPDLQRIYETVQRKTKPSRRKSIRDYIENRIGPKAHYVGAFPPICIGMTRPVKFKPTNPEQPEIGVLLLPSALHDHRIVLDGLGRLTAALDLVRENPDGNGWFTFPVTIFAPKEGRVLDVERLEQLFHDFNFLPTVVDKAHALALDHSDIYLQMVEQLGKIDVVAKNGGVEKRKATLGKNSTALTTQQLFARFVRGACEGPRAQETDKQTVFDNPNLRGETFLDLKAALSDFLTVFATRMGTRFTDHDSIHLHTLGWSTLGRIFYEMEFGPQKLVEHARTLAIYRLADVDWTRYNPDWVNLIGTETTDATGRKAVATLTRRETLDALTEYLRVKVGLSDA